RGEAGGAGGHRGGRVVAVQAAAGHQLPGLLPGTPGINVDKLQREDRVLTYLAPVHPRPPSLIEDRGEVLPRNWCITATGRQSSKFVRAVLSQRNTAPRAPRGATDDRQRRPGQTGGRRPTRGGDAAPGSGIGQTW